MNNNENTRKYRNIIDTKIVKGSRAIASTIATLICHNVEESLQNPRENKLALKSRR